MCLKRYLPTRLRLVYVNKHIIYRIDENIHVYSYVYTLELQVLETKVINYITHVSLISFLSSEEN
jgi:hypothetical protein